MAAARELVVSSGEGPPPSVGAVARRAGVSRLTIYNRFGSRARLLQAVAGEAHRRVIQPENDQEPGDARNELRLRIASSCSRWASDPALFRGLTPVAAQTETSREDRRLAERLAIADQLRPGCSLKEAEDVIGVVTSFATFDRLHQDGRRSTAAVTEILMRMAGGILA